MPLDLRALSPGSAAPLLQPRDIYAALPRRPWPYLRHEQGEVLERWFPRRDDRDLVIKQNTGGGKTVDGLLIAKSSLNEGVTPVAYLASDRYLVSQVNREASRLGIETASDPRDASFVSGNAVLVTTLQKLINGRSVFGVVGDGRTVQPLGTVIVDDAHAALAATEAQFRLRVPKSNPAYRQLVDLFAADLASQAAGAWRDIQEGDMTAVIRVPFWVWAQQQGRVMDVLHAQRNSDDLKFEWPLLEDALHVSAATVTSAAVEIRPPCPPINRIPAFHNARRRIYLTATLADDSVLVTDLDANPDLVARPVTPGRAADLGDRLILAPLELNPALDPDAVRDLARGYADGDPDRDGVAERTPINVVVLVPSTKAAGDWAGYADRVVHVGDLERTVADLKAGHVGVVVLVNKYDGVDLAGDACRLLVVDGLPRAMDAAERRDAAALAGSPTLVARQVQRVEQGMGRGVRDVDDYCAVLLMGSDLTRVVHDPAQRSLLSPATRTQVELSRDIAAQIHGEGLAEVIEAIDLCLDQDPQWTGLSRSRLAEVEYASVGSVRPAAIALREAFDQASVGRFAAAAERIQAVAETTSDPAERGWLMEQQAAYTHHVDAARAQQVLSAAIVLNPHLTRPSAGVPVARVKAADEQGRAAAEFLSQEYDGGISLVLGVRALLDEIRWDEDLTDEAEAAIERLGRHLGFASERPEKRYGTGPDDLWALSRTRHAVIELKTGSQGRRIAKKDVDQLGGSVRWHEDNYDGVTAVPVMLHPSSEVHAQGTSPSGMRVITPGKLEELKLAVTAFAVAVAQEEGHWRDHTVVTRQLAEYKLTGGTVLNKYSVAAR
jgi:hypothetical protein